MRHRHHAAFAVLQVHGRRRREQFEPAIAQNNVQRLPRGQPERITKRLGHDDPPGGIDGGSHAKNMTLPAQAGQKPASQACRAPGLSVPHGMMAAATEGRRGGA